MGNDFGYAAVNVDSGDIFYRGFLVRPSVWTDQIVWDWIHENDLDSPKPDRSGSDQSLSAALESIDAWYRERGSP